MGGRAEERRLDEVPAFRHTVGDAAFGDHFQAVRQALGDVAVDAVELGLVDDWAAGQVHVGRAGTHLGELVGQRLHEVRIDALLHQQAAAGRAGLASVVHDALDDGRDGQTVVGVVEHDVGRLAAQFQHALDRVQRGGLLDQYAYLIGTGEGDEVDVRVARQAGAGFFAQARHDVQGARGEAHFQGQLGHADDGQAGVLGRLDHRGIAHSQRRRHAAAEHLRGIVPGNDVGGDAQRFADQLDGIVFLEGDGLAVHLVGGAAVELEIARQHRDVGACCGHGLAGVARLQAGQLFMVRQHALAEAQQQPAAFQRRHAAPFAVQRPARGLHGGVDVGLLAARDRREHLAVYRRNHFDAAAVGRVDLTAVDDHLRHGKSPLNSVQGDRAALDRPNLVRDVAEQLHVGLGDHHA
ncbi:hypothetical protein D9M68_493920 [compost metagenome]